MSGTSWSWSLMPVRQARAPRCMGFCIDRCLWHCSPGYNHPWFSDAAFRIGEVALPVSARRAPSSAAPASCPSSCGLVPCAPLPLFPAPHLLFGGGSGSSASNSVATELRLLLSGHRLDPAEGFFDALADALADGVAAMPRRAPVDRRASAAGVLRDMRRHPHRSQLVDEVLRVIAPCRRRA